MLRKNIILLGLLILVGLFVIPIAQAAAPTLSLPSTLTAPATKPYIYQVSANDPDVNDTLTFNYTKPASLASFDMNSTGYISFTPTVQEIGSHFVTITVTDNTGVNDTKSTTFIVTEACNDGALKVESVDIDDVTGDDDNLLPGDYLEFDFKIRNTLSKDEDIDNVLVEVWIEDSSGDTIGDELEADEFDVNGGDSEKVTGRIRIPPDTKADDYIFYIDAEGEDQSSTTRCAVYTESIEVEREKHDMLIDTVTFTPSTAACGGVVEAAVKIYNIGRSNEDDIKLTVRSELLGISETTPQFALDDDEDATKYVQLVIPTDAVTGTYYFDITAKFNDDKDREAVTPSLTITCGAPTPTTTTGAEPTEAATGPAIVSISSTSASAALGDKIKFTMTLTNTGEEIAGYRVEVSGVEDWAVASVEPTDITLTPGGNIPIYVYLTPKESGQHSASVTVYSGASAVVTKTLTVDVAETGVQVTDWGHGISTTQLKNMFSGFVGSAMLIVFVAILAVIAFGLYLVRGREEAAPRRRRRRR